VIILKQADQPIPSFFNDTGAFVGDADDFGGSDIRQSMRPKPAATAQAPDEEW
jgi:hypothetical protein